MSKKISNRKVKRYEDQNNESDDEVAIFQLLFESTI